MGKVKLLFVVVIMLIATTLSAERRPGSSGGIMLDGTRTSGSTGGPGGESVEWTVMNAGSVSISVAISVSYNYGAVSATHYYLPIHAHEIGTATGASGEFPVYWYIGAAVDFGWTVNQYLACYVTYQASSYDDLL